MRRNVITVGFSMGSRVAPSLTAAAAERLFFATRRSQPRPGERDVLKSATTSRIAGMQAWSWGQGPTVLLVHGRWRTRRWDPRLLGLLASCGLTIAVLMLGSCAYFHGFGI